MISANVIYNGHQYLANLALGIEISIVLDPNLSTPKCFYAPDLKVEAVTSENFIGDIALGGIVNFKNIHINPHGNGTHTECVGHILPGGLFVSEALTKQHWVTRLITVTPTTLENGDLTITYQDIAAKMQGHHTDIEAMIIRTLPNDISKCNKDYSGTNPPYIEAKAMELIVSYGVQHLLVDLPSVDREEDGAKFEAHKIFWSADDGAYDTKKTITELVYIDNMVEDGLFLCSIAPLRIHMDASPSRIIIYPLVAQN